eukprot:TRINITY_DN955_c1_g1_i1.p1 TRINITY_DN955_c1_g1~~TRINITY_DN955_c1_g1_i1.p1  ORF type:complete len:638 (-),score=107.30 TRINITY_DN955_c1_g1_i1:56-1969(-)
MGATLQKPVTPIVVKRCRGSSFRCGFAEMNGWRKNMEDANVIHMEDSWGFFGVFDGHGGDQCSKFVANRIHEELKNGPPADDAAMKELMLRVDREFLESMQPSGSTGTFALVSKPDAARTDGKYSLRVGNIGDSRVLLGRADGTIVEGSGTDGGLTTDHKPDHPSEKERIERTGGFVQMVQGVARVNGDLAVSRSFGDSQYKQTGGPRQEDHPVSAEPEFTSLDCDPTDFLVIVCDGISEGAFPNREVVALAAKELFPKSGEAPDLGKAAAAVCKQAFASGSYDNLSCMIVMLGGGEMPGPELSLIPARYDLPTDGTYVKAYQAMVEHAGLTLAQAIELRHTAACKELAEIEDGPEKKALNLELESFGEGPPQSLASGSEERVAWFSEWLSKQEVEEEIDPTKMGQEELLQLMQRRPDMKAMAMAQGLIPMPEGQLVKVGPFKKVRAAVRNHPSLRWNPKLRQACDQLGRVVEMDPDDETAKVEIPQIGVTAWFPTSVLEEIDEDDDDDDDDDENAQVLRTVKVCAEEQLKEAVEKCEAIQWDDGHSQFCEQVGSVIHEDASDGTSKVRFPPPLELKVWLPTSALVTVTDGSGADAEKPGDGDGTPKPHEVSAPAEGTAEQNGEDGAESDAKRQRVA